MKTSIEAVNVYVAVKVASAKVKILLTVVCRAIRVAVTQSGMFCLDDG